MPLLPRNRKRLLGDDTHDLAPASSRRRPTANPTQTQSTLKTVSQNTQRKTRDPSVSSEISIASSSLSASTRILTRPNTGKRKAKPIVLDHSDDEEPTPPVTRSGRSGTSTLEGDNSRSTTRSTQTATVGRRKLLPADDDDGGMVSHPFSAMITRADLMVEPGFQGFDEKAPPRMTYTREGDTLSSMTALIFDD